MRKTNILIIIMLFFIFLGCETEQEVYRAPPQIVYRDKEVIKYIPVEQFVLPREISIAPNDPANSIDYENMVNRLYLATLDYKKDNSHASENFKECVDEINRVIIGYITDNTNLRDIEKQRLNTVYSVNRPYIIDVFFRRYSENIIQSPIYINEPVNIRYPNLSIVESFNRSVSACTNTLINIFFLNSLEPIKNGVQASMSLASELNITGVVLEKLLYPLSYFLLKTAIVCDHVSGKIKLISETREMIAELATVGDEFEIVYNRPIERTILKLFSQTASLAIKTNSRVKVGFDLTNGFSLKIDDDKQILTVTLPEPRILSVDTDYSIIDIKNKLFVRIEKTDINDTPVQI